MVLLLQTSLIQIAAYDTAAGTSANDDDNQPKPFGIYGFVVTN
jgi:hypothetical protein